MTRWEYRAELLLASVDVDGASEHIALRYPGWEPRRNSPQLMEAAMNERGQEGWELVHMQPVKAGANHDILHHAVNSREWSSHYFCVFKRPVG